MEAIEDLPFIVDANVLIDYCDADIEILTLLSKQIQSVSIALSTFNKVNQLTEAQAKKASLIVEIPSESIVTEALKKCRALAYDDNETLQFALQKKWRCITNDKALRDECEAKSAKVIWGLEPMKILVKREIITISHATLVAKKIHVKNPDYINAKILEKFQSQLRDLV